MIVNVSCDKGFNDRQGGPLVPDEGGSSGTTGSPAILNS